MRGMRDVTADDLARIRADLAVARDGLLARSAAEVAEILGGVGARFADPSDPLRRAALEGLPAEAALSPPLAEAVLDGMAADWTAARLVRLLEAEFDDPRVLDRFVVRNGSAASDHGEQDGGRRGRTVRAFGPSLCVQISSGGVPGVGVNALIRSLLVKAPTLIKPGAGDTLLTRLFAEALADVDPALGAAVAVRYWRGEERDVTAAALDGAEVVVAYGSDEAVRSVRNLTPATARFVGYHHRFGIGLVGREALGAGVEKVAAHVARAVAMFEHRGCVCPHIVFVEEHGNVVPEAFAELVAGALEGLERRWPTDGASGGREVERAALVQARGTVELQEAAGAARMLHGHEASWTVVFESDLVQLPQLPGRSVRIRGVSDLDDVPAMVGRAGRHLQSVGYAGDERRAMGLAEALTRAGATRIVPFEHMSFPPAWWLHDGRGPLETLVRWAEVE